MTAATEPDVHRADPETLKVTARAGLDAMVDHGAPLWRTAPIVEHLGWHGLRVSVELRTVADLEAWVEMSDDPDHPLTTGGMWLVDRHMACWVGPIQGVPATVTLLAEDPTVARDEPAPWVPLTRRPTPTRRDDDEHEGGEPA